MATSTAEPPAAPAIAPATPTSTAGVVPSSASGVIHVVPPTTDFSDTPRPGSARERMYNELRKRSKPAQDEPAPEPVKPVKEVKPVPAEPAEEADAPAAEATAEPATEPAPAKTEPAKKVSPWKLVDEFKKRAAEAEAKVIEVTKSIPSEEVRKANSEELQRKETRLKELEEEIIYVNFSKSEKFRKEYQEPYDRARNSAMSELSQINVTDAKTGEERVAQQEDLMELVYLPLGQAQDLAEERFGKFANIAMGHRKEVRSLFEAQYYALEDAKKNGSVREQQRMEQFQSMQQAMTKEVGEIWSKFNESATKDEKYGKFFTPIEGDAEGNQRLEKGYALVDKAFSENPFSPNLKSEDRAAIVKRHAAVRNRAAAFGRLVQQVSQAEAKIAALTKELEQFKTSTPPVGGGAHAATAAGPASTRDSVFDALRKLAK